MKRIKEIQMKWVLLLLVLLLTSGALAVFAKYISEERTKAEAVSAGFFVSSDYLSKEADVTYDVSDSADKAKIYLYNYELENIAKISQIDVKYKVEVSGGTCSVTDEEADANGYYTISGGAAAMHELIVTANAGKDEVTVTVTTAPFKEVLKATLRFSGETALESKIDTEGTHSVLTIHSNDYKGNVTVEWNSSAFAPDNTNAIMRDWTNSGEKSFSVDDHQVYEMIFFKIADGDANLTVEVE